MKHKSPADYGTAISRLEEIILAIEEQNLEIDLLARYIKEANSLIKFCSGKLDAVNKEVESLLEEETTEKE